MKRPAAVLLASLLTLAAPLPAYAAHGAVCHDASLRAVANRTHGRLNACVVKRRQLIMETTYYQNASKVGGTALAAFPETRLRYGVARNLEVFVDAPSEIAKSGLAGAGVYLMTHAGFGAKYEFAHVRGTVYSLSLESRPPMSVFANTDLVASSDARLSATWAPSVRSSVGAEIGMLNYATRGGHRAAATAGISFTQALNARTSLSAEFATQSVAAPGAAARATGTIGLSRALTPHLLVNLELGTTFNATGGSKPHYFGFGFVTR